MCIRDSVITVPAYFDSNRRQATMEAGMEAGFEVLDLLDEPVAALYNADTIRSYAGKTVLIYDLGGGTLDIVCAKITETSICLLYTSFSYKAAGPGRPATAG